MSKMSKNLSKEDRKMLNGIFLRSFSIFAGRTGGQVRMHAVGFIWSLLPALRRYYKDDEKGLTEALVRHTSFYNITQNVGTFCLGLVASMERENTVDDEFDDRSITAIKTALMGPMSGIGDAIFWGVVRVIAASVGIGLALQDSFLGPIMFLLIYNIPSILTRYYLTYTGFVMGSDFLKKINEGGLMQTITKCASILGLIMVGGMTASTVKFTSTVQFIIEGSDPILLQTYLDSIFMGLVPLLLTTGCLYLMLKRVNVNVIMFGVLGLSIVLALAGIV